MEHFFELPITYKGEAMNLRSRLVTFGYVYNFHVIVNAHELVFEKDDDQEYRVLITESERNYFPDKELIENIIAALKQIVHK